MGQIDYLTLQFYAQMKRKLAWRVIARAWDVLRIYSRILLNSIARIFSSIFSSANRLKQTIYLSNAAIFQENN
jgi:hypothetical protein